MNRLVKIATEGPEKRRVPRVVTALSQDLLDMLKVDLVTVWLLDSDLQAMECICSVDAEKKRNLHGVVLKRETYPTYFRYIMEDMRIGADDVYASPQLNELVDSYFNLYGVKSLLDFVIFDDVVPRAVICCETTRYKRAWTDNDIEEIRKMTVLSSTLAKWH